MLRKSFFLFWILIAAAFSLQAENIVLMTLKGYLGKEETVKASQSLDQIAKGGGQSLVVEIDSSSGDLGQLLNLAKKIYELKAEKNLKVIVYINDNAIGPAAIIPFLADELYISLFVSWGDIPSGSEGSVSTNVLRNRVASLVSPSHPRAAILQLLAAAMSDKSVQIIEEGNGWKLAPVLEKSPVQSSISVPGETLVVNQNQLKKLGLISGILSPEKFQQQYPFTKAQSQQMQQEVIAPSPVVPENVVIEKFKAHIKYDPNGKNVIGHILIDDRTSGINESTWLYVKKALDYYKKVKPDFIILELNTPGGEVFAAQKISDALKEMDTQNNIPVVAYINNWAISAGAMLAYSSRFIIATKDGSMGAAEPVIGTQAGEMKEASEKVNSAIRADFANRARFFDRNPYIAEAMVDKDVILVMRHGKIIRLDSESQIRTSGSDPDILISPKGKLLTLNAEQMIAYGVADLLALPKQLEIVTPEEQSKGLWPAGKSLIFQSPFFNQIPNAVIDSYRMDWKTRFFVFLSHPVVSSILFLGMMLGFYLELSTPGASLPGIVAGICLFLIILSSFALDIGNILELILLCTGILIIIVELFVLPTFGFLGFFGILLFIAGLFGLMLPGIESFKFEYDTQTVNAAGEAVLHRLAWLCATMILGFIIIALIARYVAPSFAGWSRLVLTGNEQDASLGYIAGENPAELPPAGTKGEALSALRPSGKVIINETIYDAISDGKFIDMNEPIVVLEIDGSVLVVASDKKEETNL